MIKTNLVYKYVLSQLCGEHFGKSEPLPDKDEFVVLANGYVKLSKFHFDEVFPGEKIEFTNEFDTANKCYLFEKGFFEMIRKRWNVTDEQIIQRGLCELPTFIENRLICRKLKYVFGEQIFQLPLFANDEFLYDRRQFKQGFMRPIFRHKHIIGFEVFRNIKDSHPIVLSEQRTLAA